MEKEVRILAIIFIVGVILTLSLTLINAYYLEENTDNSEIKSIMSSDNSSNGYIIQFKDPPLLEQQTQDNGNIGIQSVGSIDYKSRLENEHLVALEDIQSILSDNNLASMNPLSRLINFFKELEKNIFQIFFGLKLTGFSVSDQQLRPEAEYFYVFNGAALNINEEQAKEIKKSFYVKAIYPNNNLHILLSDAVPLIGADKVWQMQDNSGNNITGKNITVAILDTGVDYTQPDLGGCTKQQFLAGTCSKVVGGYDFINNDNDPMDDHGHGTHVAGIIAANGIVKGVAPYAKIMSYKICDSGGNCYLSTIISGIEKAVVDNVSIISLSIGGPGNPYDIQSQAIDNAVNAGVVAVIAAGNSGPGLGTINSPGTARKAITVGASNNDIGRNSTLIVDGSLISSNGLDNSFIGNVSAQIKNVNGIGNPSDFISSGNFLGKIALIKRGSITFTQKVQNAVAAGAIGVIIYNNNSGNFQGVLTNKSVIPVVFISFEDGTNILNNLSSGSVFANIIVVKDPNYSGLIPDYSSRGPTSINTIKPDIVAPGDYICSTRYDSSFPGYECIDNSHAYLSGTSMATPIVSGVVALIMQAHPDWTPDEIKMALRSTAIDLGYSPFDQGYGRVNANAAALSSIPCVAEISYIDFNSSLLGIYGTANCRNGFNNWKIEYGNGTNPQSWEIINSSNIPSINGLISYFNISNLGTNNYLIKLTVNNKYIDEIYHSSNHISNCVELQNIRINPSADYVLDNDIDCSDTKNWNQGQGFMPIGGEMVGGNYIYFNGNFNGQGHVINNLYINRSDRDNVGLFGAVNGTGYIENLILNNSYIVGNDDTGSIIGAGYYESIINCSVFGNIYGNDDVGLLAGSFGTNEIINSYSIGNVYANTFAGIFIGSYNYGNIFNSYAIGNISGVTSIGGFVGELLYAEVYNSSSLSNVYSTGSYIGGLAGDLIYSNIEDSYSISIINHNSVQGSYIGGLAGGGLYSHIYNSYSICNITSNDSLVGCLIGGQVYGIIVNSYSNGNVYGYQNLGGLCGYSLYGIISNSYSNANVSGFSISGGLIGDSMWDNISNSFSTGSVFGPYVKGLIGSNTYDNISNCFWNNQSSKLVCGSSNCTIIQNNLSYFYYKENAPMSSWDFTDIWAINESQGYPYFVWQRNPIINNCTISLTNTSWSSWTNISCSGISSVNQSRNLTRYDSNNCGTVLNQTFFEYNLYTCNDNNQSTYDFCNQTKNSCQFTILPDSDNDSSFCGDGVVDPGEECDLNNITETCISKDYTGGIISCNTNCTLNLNACTSGGGNNNENQGGGGSGSSIGGTIVKSKNNTVNKTENNNTIISSGNNSTIKNKTLENPIAKVSKSKTWKTIIIFIIIIIISIFGLIVLLMNFNKLKK